MAVERPTRDLSFVHDYDVELLDCVPATGIPRYYYPPGSSCGGRDGLIVRVESVYSGQHSWIGQFAFGDEGTSGVYAGPGKSQLSVVSRGEGYIVDVADPSNWQRIQAGPITQVIPVLSRGLLVFADPWHLCAYGSLGIAWGTVRLAADGFKIVEVTDDRITAEGDSLVSELDTFSIDLASGAVAFASDAAR